MRFAAILLLSFGPNLLIGSISLPTARIAYFALASLGGYLLFQRRRLGERHDLLVVLALILLATMALSALHLFSSQFFVSYALASVLNYLAIYFLWTSGSKMDESELLVVTYFVGVFHGVIMVLSLFVIPFRELLYTFVETSSTAKMLLGYNLRTSGLMFSSFSILSTIMSLFFALGFFYRTEVERKLGSRIGFYCCQIVIIGSVFVSGRTGIVNILVLVVLLAVLGLLQRKPLLVSRTLLLSAFGFVGLVLVLVSVFDLTRFTEFATWAFELFINLFVSGRLETQSTTILLDGQFFLPDSALGLLLGQGLTWADVHSDVGYVQAIFDIGVVGLSLYLFFFALVSWRVYLRYQLVSREFFLMLFYVIVLLYGNLKDLYFFFLNGYSVVFFVFYFRAFPPLNRLQVRTSQ